MYKTLCMRTNLYSFHFLLFLLIAAVPLSSCKKGSTLGADSNTTKCNPNNLPNQFRSIFLSDPIPNSTEEQALAVFHFSQTMKSYANTPCKALPNECGTTLRVQNVSGKKMKLAYSVIYSQGNNNWQSDGFVELLPDSSCNVGTITSNCGWITTEGLRVLKRSLSLD